MLTSLYSLFYVTGECHRFYTENEPYGAYDNFSPPLQYNVENQTKLQVVVFKLCIVRTGKTQQLTAADGAVSSASS